MIEDFQIGFEKTAFLGAAARGIAAAGSKLLGKGGRALLKGAKNVGTSLKANPVKTVAGLGGKALGVGIVGSEVMGIKDKVTQQMARPNNMSITSPSFFSPR